MMSNNTYIVYNEIGKPYASVVAETGKIEPGEQFLGLCLLTGSVFLSTDQNRKSMVVKKIRHIEHLDTTDRFKKSPIHDKNRIIDELDKLNPSEMNEVVELLNKLNQNKDE
jgi:ligand-binding sensor protein